MSRGDQIKGAIDLLWTGLTGTRKEVLARAEAVGTDVIEQVERHRRPLNAAIPAHGEPAAPLEAEDEAPVVEATATPVCAICGDDVPPGKRVCSSCIAREADR